MYVGDLDARAQTHDAFWWEGEFDVITEEEANNLKQEWLNVFA